MKLEDVRVGERYRYNHLVAPVLGGEYEDQVCVIVPRPDTPLFTALMGENALMAVFEGQYTKGPEGIVLSDELTFVGD